MQADQLFVGDLAAVQPATPSATAADTDVPNVSVSRDDAFAALVDGATEAARTEETVLAHAAGKGVPTLLELYRTVLLPGIPTEEVEVLSEEMTSLVIRHTAPPFLLAPKAAFALCTKVAGPAEGALDIALDSALHVAGAKSAAKGSQDALHFTPEPLVDWPSAVSIIGGEELESPRHLQSFTWGSSCAREIVYSFSQQSREKRLAHLELRRAEVERALALAAAASARCTAGPNPSANARGELGQMRASDDLVLWMAQEDAAASSVLRELRVLQSRARKGSARGPFDAGSIWGLLAPRSSKMKPQAAAEMARARVAAAAAAAAMRGPDQKSGAGRSSGADAMRKGLSTDEAEGQPGAPDRIAEGASSRARGIGALRREKSAHGRAGSVTFALTPDESSPRKSPGFPRSLSLDSTTRLQNLGTTKRVEFAADTVFSRPRGRR